jgi:hypothetical protein
MMMQYRNKQKKKSENNLSYCAQHQNSDSEYKIKQKLFDYTIILIIYKF